MSEFVNKLFNLEGRVAVVTGGGGHVCGEMVRGLGKAGCHVAVVDLRPEKAEAQAAEVAKLCGIEAIGVAADMSKKEDVIAALETIDKSFGSVDIVVNGAGANSAAPYFEIEPEQWNEVFDSQMLSTFLGCQVFGEYLVKKKSGSVINISSASAGPPLSKAFAYSAAKAGIKNLTQNLGREWATTGVRVNAIRPGFFPTDWNRKNFITPEREADILRHTPMGRYGDVRELVGALIWLASDASSFVTGAEIAVDGGFSCMTV